MNDDKAGRGVFIAVDGQNGSGKGVLLHGLRAALEARTGREVVVVREPGGTALGEQIRSLLLDPVRAPMDGETALFLFSASRRELLRTVVRPALERGAIVLADRFVPSTYVYQGAQGVPVEVIEQVTAVAVGDCWPDCTIVLTVPPEVQRERIGERGLSSEQFEAEELANASEYSRRYADAARRLPHAQVLSGAGSFDEVLGRVLGVLDDVLHSRLTPAAPPRPPSAGLARGR